jgi:hypothetical protein
MKGIAKLLFLIVIGIVLSFILSCGENENNEPNLTSPTETLREFMNAHNHYQEPLAYSYLKQTVNSDFTFYFDPKDISKKTPNGYLIPDHWGRDEFLQVCKNMFDKAYSISFAIAGLDEGLGEPQGDEFTANDVQINIILYIDQSHGYQAIGQVDWKFNKDSDNKWRISEIHDKTSPEILSINSASYGFMLALFHE